MAVRSQKQSRELAVLGILNGSKTSLSSGAIAHGLGVKADSIYEGRKVQHIIGDLVYEKNLRRSSHVVRVKNKQLPTYVLTDKGREQLVAWRGEQPKHFELAPGVIFEKPEPLPVNHKVTRADMIVKQVESLPLPVVLKKATIENIRRETIEDVFEIPASRRELTKKPVLGEAKLVVMGGIPGSFAAQKIVPLPEREVVTPPYPIVGKLVQPAQAPVTKLATVNTSTSTPSPVDVRLRELIESMKGDGGRSAFLQVAHATLENEQRLKRIEAALTAFTQTLMGQVREAV